MQELMIPVLLLCNYNNTMHRLPKSRTLGPGWIELVTDSRIHVFSVTVANLHRTNECLFQTLPRFLSRVPHTVEKHPSLHYFVHYFHKYRHSALILMAKSAMFRFVLFLEYSEERFRLVALKAAGSQIQLDLIGLRFSNIRKLSTRKACATKVAHSYEITTDGYHCGVTVCIVDEKLLIIVRI